MLHKPVLVKEILKYLNVGPNINIIDGTLGQAGHALSILQKNGPKGKVLGIDSDIEQIKISALRTKEYSRRIILVHDSYKNIKIIAEKYNFFPVHGILLDLGYSIWHIENSGRGFSFNKNEPLDMRYNSSTELTAQIIVNTYSEEKIENILKIFGEEKFAGKIARLIVQKRKIKPINTTFELKEIIMKALSGKYFKKKIHPATKTFQALRIAVNKELENLATALPDAFSLLLPKGRLAVISFHSLEDRIVKNFFINKAKESLAKIINKKPITASQKELSENIRARSAKLRILEKI